MAAQEHVESILGLAAQAPSGDNAQPWRFEVHGDTVEVYNIPGKDYSPYNFLERGSFFAHGAVIENIVIAASSFGYAVHSTLFPKPEDRECVTRLVFTEKAMAAESLGIFIGARTTNRKPYKKIGLVPEHRRELLKVVDDAGFGTMTLIEAREQISIFARTVCLSDQLIFEDKKIHDAIFASIRWTARQEAEKPGLYIKTLELPPPARAMFKLLKNWKALTFLNHVKVSRFIAAQSSKAYAASSAIGMLVIPGDTPEDFVKAGRVFQRFWLTATQLGVSIQPVTALAYLAARIAAGEGGLSASHESQIVHAQNRINELFGNPPGTVAMMFRAGYGEKPSAHSQKAAPEIKREK